MRRTRTRYFYSKNKIKDCIKPACILALIPTHFTVKWGAQNPKRYVLFPHIPPKNLTGLYYRSRHRASCHHRERNHSKNFSAAPHQRTIIAETDVLLCCAVIPAYRGKIKNRATMKDPSDIESLGNEHL